MNVLRTIICWICMAIYSVVNHEIRDKLYFIFLMTAKKIKHSSFVGLIDKHNEHKYKRNKWNGTVLMFL